MVFTGMSSVSTSLAVSVLTAPRGGVGAFRDALRTRVVDAPGGVFSPDSALAC